LRDESICYRIHLSAFIVGCICLTSRFRHQLKNYAITSIDYQLPIIKRTVLLLEKAISINCKVNLKSNKNLQFMVFVSLFQERLKRITGLNSAGCPQSAGNSNLRAIGQAT